MGIAIAIAIAWGAIAVPVGILIGKCIRKADEDLG